jgi:hypothetical protein
MMILLKFHTSVAAAGYISGCGDGIMRHNNPITCHKADFIIDVR